MPGQAVLDSLRAQLEGERASLRRQLTDLGAGDTAPSFDENFADSGQVAAEQGESRMLAASLTDQLQDVEKALAKMDWGDCGRWEACGKDTADPGLEAMPAARHCIDHA